MHAYATSPTGSDGLAAESEGKFRLRQTLERQGLLQAGRIGGHLSAYLT